MMVNPDDVDPVMLAVSDLLVLVALERGFARVVPRSLRPRVPSAQRHRGYEQVPIRPDANQTMDQVLDKALIDAWVLCPVLASRNRFDVDVASWVQALDTYTRSLIAMCQPHSPSRLRPVLAGLVTAAAAAEFRLAT